MKPFQHITYSVNLGPLWQGGAVDHQDRQPQLPCGDQLGPGPAATGILADDQVDGMIAQQGGVTLNGEGAAIHRNAVAGQGRRNVGGIDQTQQVMMLRCRPEFGQMHPPKCQHDPLRRPVQRTDGSTNIRHMAPVIAGAGDPGRAAKRDQRHVGHCGGLYSVLADPGSKGMGCVDQVGDCVIAQIICQSRYPAKAAHADSHGLLARVPHPSGIGQRGGQSSLGKVLGQFAGFGRAAKDQDVRHGG